MALIRAKTDQAKELRQKSKFMLAEPPFDSLDVHFRSSSFLPATQWVYQAMCSPSSLFESREQQLHSFPNKTHQAFFELRYSEWQEIQQLSVDQWDPSNPSSFRFDQSSIISPTAEINKQCTGWSSTTFRRRIEHSPGTRSQYFPLPLCYPPPLDREFVNYRSKTALIPKPCTSKALFAVATVPGHHQFF